MPPRWFRWKREVGVPGFLATPGEGRAAVREGANPEAMEGLRGPFLALFGTDVS